MQLACVTLHFVRVLDHVSPSCSRAPGKFRVSYAPRRSGEEEILYRLVQEKAPARWTSDDLAIAQRLADEEHPTAMYEIGSRACNNHHYVTCFRWNLKAAELGHPVAMLVTGYAYLNGHGVQQDLLLGAMWLRLYLSQEDHPTDYPRIRLANAVARLDHSRLEELDGLVASKRHVADKWSNHCYRSRSDPWCAETNS